LARGFTAVVPNRTGGQETFDGSFRNAFVLHEDFVIDCATGLMWQRATSGPFTISEAFAHIHRLNRNRLGGYSDWRLPTAEELASLTQAQGYSTSFLVPGIELHLDPNYFRGESYFCMSSDRISSDPYRGMVAIITWAGPGNFGFMRPDDDYPVKAVRTLR
jgi:hypothetical protein